MINPKIRLAEDSEAPQVKAILKECALIPDGLDWSRIYPSWIIAEHKGEIVAVCQILQGYPLGHIGFLAVTKKYQTMGFGVILLRNAEGILGAMGCDGYTGLTDHKHILRKLTQLGATVFGGPVSWMFKRVYRQDVIYEGLSENHPQH